MRLYYRASNGNTGMVRDVDLLPSNIDKLIVRRYDGSELQLNRIDTLNHLILDCNGDEIHDMLFKCDKLSIYKPNIEWFRINNTWDDRYDQLHSTFNTLVRLKLELIKYAYGMFKNTLCINIIPELDFSNVDFPMMAHNMLLVPVFYNTQLKTIPKMINPPEISYMVVFKGTLIPESKLKVADVLLKISKKGEPS